MKNTSFFFLWMCWWVCKFGATQLSIYGCLLQVIVDAVLETALAELKDAAVNWYDID